MGIETSGVVLFVHIGLVVVGLMMAAVLHCALIALRRSHEVAEMRPWVPVIGRLEPILPVVALGVLASGAWLVHLSGGEAKWSDGWIYVSLAGLVIAEAIGGLLLSPVSRDLTEAINAAPEGPASSALVRLSRHPMLWYGAHFVTAEFFGIIFVMSAKPGVGGSVASLVVAGVLGAGSAVPFVASGRPRTDITSQPDDRVLTGGG